MILRIILRDVLGYAALPEITEEISNLADAILDFIYQRIRAQPGGRNTASRSHPRQTVSPRECSFAVLALGKLGGRELNYSSDIDLMFLYSGSRPDRPVPSGSPTKNSFTRWPTNTSRCCPPTRRKDTVTGWICGCVPTAGSVMSA